MKNVFIIALMHLSLVAFGKTWRVGPNLNYTSPSQVSSLVGNGDSVLIEAATYFKDVCIWTANDLFITGIGGYAILDAQQTGYGGKAIWVIAGNNTKISFIEFQHCEVVDRNGAGIRQEGSDLHLSHCRFLNNQNGILAGDHPDSDIVIEHCEFGYNGSGTGYTHNIYVNHVRSLRIQYCYMHHAYYGHELKSRAHQNIILYNRITNEDGDASYEIDLPNGGQSLVLGNIIQQSRFSDNNTMISYGREGLTNQAPHVLYFLHNTVVNNEDKGILLNVQSKTDTLVSYNNLIAGNLTILSGIPEVYTASNNIVVNNIGDCFFKDATNYDFHLTEQSPGLDAAKKLDRGFLGYELNAEKEYVHPVKWNFRYQDGKPDIGAHEKQQLTHVTNADKINLYPFHFDVNNKTFRITGPKESHFDKKWIRLFNVENKILGQFIYREGQGVQLPNLPSGYYFFVSHDSDARVVWPFIF